MWGSRGGGLGSVMTILVLARVAVSALSKKLRMLTRKGHDKKSATQKPTRSRKRAIFTDRTRLEVLQEAQILFGEEYINVFPGHTHFNEPCHIPIFTTVFLMVDQTQLDLLFWGLFFLWCPRHSALSVVPTLPVVPAC